MKDKIFVILILLCIIFTETKSYSQLDNCYPEEQGKDCGDWNTYGFDMIHLGCS